MRSLAAFRRLSAAERLTFLGALVLLPALAIALRVAGLRRVQALLARGTQPLDETRTPACALDSARRIAWLVDAAARNGAHRASCLPRALATQWLLRRHAIAADLRLGVRKSGDALDAHAWVEHDGVPVGGAGDGGFAPFEAAI